MFCRVSSCYLRGVGNPGPNLGAKLLNSPVSFSFGLCFVANHVLRLSVGRNRLDIGLGFFVFGERIQSFIQRVYFFILRIESFKSRARPVPFSVEQVVVQRLNLAFAGANHRERDDHRKDKFFFISAANVI